MKKVMANCTLPLLALTVGFFSFNAELSIVSAETPSSSKLTSEQVVQKFEEIDKKYPYNVELSKEDAKFIKEYADPNPALFGPDKAKAKMNYENYGKDSRYFNKSGSGSGISATINGYVWDDIGIINNSFGAYFSTSVNSGKATKIVNSVSITSYGLVGSGGIGKVYSKTLSSSNTNQNYLYSDMSQGYTASVAYSSKFAKSVISNNSGSFTVATY
ncbi:hypothetical protein [Bacillus cereus]|uniref:hypothetical protein n=1 Tax=Bacillus cereus TaxID=1396 RepID=UPI000BF3AAAE|nr:hypothetical protein [Bacillus cereus]PES23079.1 hypothetical protein CN496_28490 [Bacillus cereus]